MERSRYWRWGMGERDVYVRIGAVSFGFMSSDSTVGLQIHVGIIRDYEAWWLDVEIE